ncbi:hypothetical protein GCM10009716_30380 [Streptomyces sodiiphilus]|uniref:Uncharacterized protein n=1 Tax=Streptomyces sodiiphilus TaxID=226217 RepID=A0ABN2PHM3_9ACTN
MGGGQDLLPLEGADPPASSDAEGLTVQVGHGDCDADFGVWVKETEDLVILGGWSVPDPEAEVCNDMLVIDPVEVELDAELGGRVVVDAVHGTDLFEERFPPLD